MNREELHWLIFDNLFRSQHIGPESELQAAANDLVDKLRPALSAALHNSIMRGELELEEFDDMALNYARVHRWIDALFGPMPTPDLSEVTK